jgi:pilus assembly protein Flp/PilA
MNNLPWVAPLIVLGARKAASISHWVCSRLAHAKTTCGQGLVEYALILALIAIVTIGVLTELGGKTSEVFSSVNCTLDGGAVASSDSSHPGNPQGGGGGLGNNTPPTTPGGC